jgi:hypothetical protein
MQALLAAESLGAPRPRILGAPGLDTATVTAALAVVAAKLRGFVYAAGVGADVAAVNTYRGTFSAKELELIWPNTSNPFAGDAVARALGQRSAIDQAQGWNKTLSNVPIAGVTGLSQPVTFAIDDPNNDAGLLNAAGVTTIVQANGFRFWGNRTCSAVSEYAFESSVRSSQALQDEIAQGLIWAIDKPMTKGLIRDIEETGNARFRALTAQGRIVGGRMWIDYAQNNAADLAAGKLVIDYEFTPTAPLESLTLNQIITDRYYADFSLLAA